MEMRDSLIAVTRAVAAASNSTGPASSRPHVERLLHDPDTADTDDLYMVAGMRLDDFYSHSREALPENTEVLWSKISVNLSDDIALQLDGKPQVKLPKPGRHTTLGQLAVYLTHELE